MDNKEQLKRPTLDTARFKRDRKAAFMAWTDALKTYLWAYDSGSMRYVTVYDNANRLANPLHPPANAQGKKTHILHQSKLKLLLHEAFSAFEQDIIADHPNTEDNDPMTGWTIAFGTNLLHALEHDIMPRTSAGNAASTHKFRQRLQQFPGLEYGQAALKGWSSDMILLYNDMKESGLVTTDAQTVADLELILQNKDTVNNNIFWARCTDQFKNETGFAGGTLTVNAYIQKIKSYAETALCAKGIGKEVAAQSSTKHFKPVFHASATTCWVCRKTNHTAESCNMLKTALDQYRSRHLHAGKQNTFTKPRTFHRNPSHSHNNNHSRPSSSKFAGGPSSHKFPRPSHNNKNTFTPRTNKHNNQNKHNTRPHTANAILPPPPPLPSSRTTHRHTGPFRLQHSGNRRNPDCLIRTQRAADSRPYSSQARPGGAHHGPYSYQAPEE